MKKETVNTFNQGLNMDLNAIVTPNDVLTDNINGAFLTFNGDELSLQPDAGNTRIPTGTVGEVKLSDGFYPIGIKEYGGILYIVSAKDGEGEKLIEFGSYPSPRNSNPADDIQATQNIILNEENLYTAQLTNGKVFGSGTFIRFGQSSGTMISSELLWTPKSLVMPYDIRLQLKMNNGIIDLSHDVWAQYDIYMKKPKSVDSQTTHWIQTKEFAYFCPFNYKGELYVKTVLDEPIFEFSQMPNITTDETGRHIFNYELLREDSSSLRNIHYEIKLSTFGRTEAIYHAKEVTGTTSIIINESGSDINTVLYYEIIPSFSFKYNPVYVSPITDFPEEFQQHYKLSGHISVSDRLTTAGFTLAGDVCLEDGTKRYNVAYLVGPQGYIGFDLDELGPTDSKLVMVHKDASYEDDGNTIIIGHYQTIKNKLEVIPTTEANKFDVGVFNTLVSKLTNMTIEEYSPACFGSLLTFYFSAPLVMDSPYTFKHESLTAFQSNVQEPLPIRILDNGERVEIGVAPKDGLILIFKSELFEDTTFRFNPDMVMAFLTLLRINPELRITIPLILKYSPLRWEGAGTSRQELLFKTFDMPREYYWIMQEASKGQGPDKLIYKRSALGNIPTEKWTVREDLTVTENADKTLALNLSLRYPPNSDPDDPLFNNPTYEFNEYRVELVSGKNDYDKLAGDKILILYGEFVFNQKTNNLRYFGTSNSSLFFLKKEEQLILYNKGYIPKESTTKLIS